MLGLPMPKSADAPPNNLAPSSDSEDRVFRSCGREQRHSEFCSWLCSILLRELFTSPKLCCWGKTPIGDDLLGINSWTSRGKDSGRLASRCRVRPRSTAKTPAASSVKMRIETLCVIPSLADNHPYTVIEASLIPGLNLIACRSGGVPEILRGAERQLCDSLPMDLAERIRERVNTPLGASELARYNWRAANERWLEFHRKAAASAKAHSPRALPERKLTVDVCVTYFQKGGISRSIDGFSRGTNRNRFSR